MGSLRVGKGLRIQGGVVSLRSCKSLLPFPSPPPFLGPSWAAKSLPSVWCPTQGVPAWPAETLRLERGGTRVVEWGCQSKEGLCLQSPEGSRAGWSPGCTPKLPGAPGPSLGFTSRAELLHCRLRQSRGAP